MTPDDEDKKFPGRLPRLPRAFYQGDAFVHWTMSTHDRATGWLTETFHARFRELMLHAAAREGLFCPAYCLMPDHLHLVWLGLRLDSDQRNAMAFLRTYLEPALAHSQPVGDDVRSRPNETNQALLTSCPTKPVGDEVTSRPPETQEHSSRRVLQRRVLQIKFQPQAHDSVLRTAEREHGAFAKVCFYILDNPVKAELVRQAADWKFSGAIVPGYPTLHPLKADFWEKFWKLYAQALQPDAGNLKRPPF
jgi:putative transposase